MRAGRPRTAVLWAAPGQPRALLVLVAGVAVLAGLLGALGGGAPGAAPDGAGTERHGTRAVEGAAAEGDLPRDTVMVWSGFRLGEGYAQAVAEDERLGPTALVTGEVRGLVATRDAEGAVVDELPDPWRYPVEVLATTPEAYDEVAGRSVLGDLGPGQVVLSETSAEVRGLGQGAVLEFEDGAVVTVADVLPDATVGSAEVLAHADGPLAAETEKYLLVRTGGDDVTDVLLDLRTDEREPRVVPHGHAPVLRHAHSVLPPAERKARFGEFAIRNLPGRDFRAGQTWIDEHIVVDEVPILGRVRCHEAMFEPLRAAMQELRDRGAEDAIRDYAGCWVPRTSGSDGPPSSHAWGISIDFNAATNPYGAEPDQPHVLVEVMREHGFAWGGDWDTPDAMHFELAPGRDPAG